MREALDAIDVPAGSRQFVNFTFDWIERGRLPEIAAVFTFGREDLIPNLFIALANQLQAQSPGQPGLFTYHLERHIEVDGDHHAHLAKAMTTELCGTDAGRWQEATDAVEAASQARLKPWDSVYKQINQPQPQVA